MSIAGVGAVAPGSFASLFDDPLFLSRAGVAAITSSSLTGEKIIQNRSLYLNAQLTNEPSLPEAEAAVWQGMYLLAVPEGHVYILNGRQTKTFRSSALGDFVYEVGTGFRRQSVIIINFLSAEYLNTHGMYQIQMANLVGGGTASARYLSVATIQSCKPRQFQDIPVTGI